MKALLRYFIILAACLIPVTFMDGIKDRFLIELGVLLGVTSAYWVGYALLERKRRRQGDKDVR